MVNTPKAAIRINAKKRAISISFHISEDLRLNQRNHSPVTLFLFGCKRFTSPRKKKADVAEHPKVLDHVGLLTNEPPGTAELLSI